MGSDAARSKNWIPACAGMTDWGSTGMADLGSAGMTDCGSAGLTEDGRMTDWGKQLRFAAGRMGCTPQLALT